MNGEVDSGKKMAGVEDDIDVSDQPEDTIVLDDFTDIDNIGDISVEINVEELIAKIEAGDGDTADHKLELRRRLDALEDQRRTEKELESTYNFNLDDDL
ncbi:MAG: hypothetical protein OEM60_05810 [Gammaproteobacteria bacterium]|nr:hypothetical protein [Gammaproteobacteria bacterium]MDH3433351.1 hypothetical protein [Gammaproteobacteria bacterium]